MVINENHTKTHKYYSLFDMKRKTLKLQFTNYILIIYPRILAVVGGAARRDRASGMFSRAPLGRLWGLTDPIRMTLHVWPKSDSNWCSYKTGTLGTKRYSHQEHCDHRKGTIVIWNVIRAIAIHVFSTIRTRWLFDRELLWSWRCLN